MSVKLILRSIVFSQVMVLIYSTILLFFPQYYGYVILLIIATFFAYSIFTSIKRARVGSVEDLEYVNSGRVIVKAQQSKIIELMNKDDKLMNDMRPQMTFMSISLINLPVTFGIYYGYIWFVMPFFSHSGNLLVTFLGYVLMFEILFMAPWIINRLILRGKEIRMIQIPRDYIITSKGVRATGLLIKFPIENPTYSFKCSKRRRFIDIESQPQIQAITGAKIITVYRLYMPEQDLLKTVEALSKYSNISLSCDRD
ncbi:MAG: DUF2208 family protein [Sulfolobales archaeon]